MATRVASRPAASGPARDRAPASRAISFAVVSTLAGLRELGPEWRRLSESHGLPHQAFQQFDWLALWAELYLDRTTRLAVVTGRIEGHLVLVWPLVVRHRLGLRVLTGMGEPLSQYSDAVLASGLSATEVDAALAYAASLPVDVIALRHVRDDAALAPALRRRFGSPHGREAAPVLEFAGIDTVKTLEQRYDGKLRSSRRRRRRRLEERGPVTVEAFAASQDAMPYVATALGFKRAWAHRHGMVAPALRNPRFERHLVAAAALGGPGADLRTLVMRCGPEVVGVALSLACKGRLFGHVLATQPALDRYGLGGLLAEQTIMNALAEGFEALDMLAPADPYKLEWTTTSVGVGDYALARTVRGSLYMRLWAKGGRRAAKRLAGRLAPVLARRRGARTASPDPVRS